MQSVICLKCSRDAYLPQFSQNIFFDTKIYLHDSSCYYITIKRCNCNSTEIQNMLIPSYFCGKSSFRLLHLTFL